MDLKFHSSPVNSIHLAPISQNKISILIQRSANEVTCWKMKRTKYVSIEILLSKLYKKILVERVGRNK